MTPKPDVAALVADVAALHEELSRMSFPVAMVRCMLDRLDHDDTGLWDTLEGIHERLEELRTLLDDVTAGVADLLAWHETRSRLEVVARRRQKKG